MLEPGQFEVKARMKQTGWRLIVKKVLDRTVAAGLLVAMAPVLGVAAAAVRASMGGPVFFRQTRVGLHEKTFEIIKLRTMNDARGLDGELLPDEQRLSRIGQFLRTTSIDELPQLLNVVRGDLSLVGPRPFLTKYLERYTQEERRRHDVLPGMTGWAIVHGRNAVDWDERLALDVWYVNRWSLPPRRQDPCPHRAHRPRARGHHASRARNDAQSPSIARAPGRMDRCKTCSAGWTACEEWSGLDVSS